VLWMWTPKDWKIFWEKPHSFHMIHMLISLRRLAWSGEQETDHMLSYHTWQKEICIRWSKRKIWLAVNVYLCFTLYWYPDCVDSDSVDSSMLASISNAIFFQPSSVRSWPAAFLFNGHRLCAVIEGILWAIFSYASSEWVGRVWSAREKSLEILRHGWELHPSHREDRQWDSFFLPPSYHDCNIKSY